MRTKTVGAVALAIVAIGVIAGPAAAEMNLNPAKNRFYFHANVGSAWADKRVSVQGITVELWNFDPVTKDLTSRVIAGSVPAGGCVDRGAACKYRNRDAAIAHNGVVSFRMQYQSGKMWMRELGSVENDPTDHMAIVLTLGGDTSPDAEAFLAWKFSGGRWKPDWTSQS
ncbi:MAG TPA: hypothetical protein VL856_08130 [Acidimicrobiia bacterium]|jgi:hypothetical protein|nr:hypothetical protein [Acidimicrobiia bacterium]